MREFHKDRKNYFNFIYKTSRDFIVPFIEEHRALNPNDKILEIGSGEGGVLKAFTERGHQCLGIELMQHRVDVAEEQLQEEIKNGQVKFITRNIYDINPEEELDFRFDVILLKDVIEHIFDQEKFMSILGNFLNPGGRVFFGFPPWQMPFGGHQQVCKNKLLSRLPFFHLLPRPIYKGMLNAFGEPDYTVKELLELKETGLSIERFERIVKAAGYTLAHKSHYLINPVYSFKFGMKPRKQFGLLSSLPWVRNFYTTGVYYLVERG